MSNSPYSVGSLADAIRRTRGSRRTEATNVTVLRAQGIAGMAKVILNHKPLLPSDPYERGVVRALTKEIELYIELPARSCFMEVFFGGKVDQAIKDKARVELLAGVATLARHGRFAPYVAGNEMTVADIFLLYSFDLASTVAQKLFDIDLKAELPQAAALLELLAQNPNVQKVAADRDAEMAAFMAAIRAARK